MNVENNQENLQTVEKTVSSNGGLSDNITNDSGNGNTSVSAGDSGQTQPIDVSGDGDTSTVTESNDIVSGNGVYTGTSATTENVQYLAQISQGITALNSTVTLLFFFLLMAWAEKKINIVVRRFSEKR